MDSSFLVGVSPLVFSVLSIFKKRFSLSTFSAQSFNFQKHTSSKSTFTITLSIIHIITFTREMLLLAWLRVRTWSVQKIVPFSLNFQKKIYNIVWCVMFKMQLNKSLSAHVFVIIPCKKFGTIHINIQGLVEKNTARQCLFKKKNHNCRFWKKN